MKNSNGALGGGDFCSRRVEIIKGSKILDLTGTRTPTSSVVQPVTCRYTDCAIPAPLKGSGFVNSRSVRKTEQGEPRHRKYKKLKLAGDQAYDRSSD
jgi:hypothetical protein